MLRFVNIQVNHKTQPMVGTPANAIHLDVASPTIAARAMSWLANPSVSVRPPVTGLQRNSPPVSVSRILDLRICIDLFFICVNLTCSYHEYFHVVFFLITFFDPKRKREINNKCSIQ